MVSSPGHAPLRYVPARWMQFVDGENIAIRAKKLFEQSGIAVPPCRQYMPDCMIVPNQNPNVAFGPQPQNVEPTAIRSFYYTSLVGDDLALLSVRTQLRALGFDPNVFKRNAGQAKAKGVDIALTKDMLSHAFRGNYEVALLIAGDGDYVPLVDEVKRLGKRVEVRSIDQWTSLELKLSADSFVDITDFLLNFAKTKVAEPGATMEKAGGPPAAKGE